MAEVSRYWFDCLQTPVDELVIIATEAGCLRAVGWPNNGGTPADLLPARESRSFVLERKQDVFGLTSALRAYFAGEFSVIEELRAAAPGTEFQQSIWSLLRQIPCGTTISYGELARRLGNPKAVRAVGLANGANPVCIVVPCHRVIGANGSLTGYGGGIERKRWLLLHERARMQSTLKL